VTKVDLEYVNSFIDRHGHKRHYFRKGGKRYPIPGAPGTAVFAEAYDKLLAEHAPHLVLRQGRSISRVGLMRVASFAHNRAWLNKHLDGVGRVKRSSLLVAPGLHSKTSTRIGRR
jgi:hypothetical protein